MMFGLNPIEEAVAIAAIMVIAVLGLLLGAARLDISGLKHDLFESQQALATCRASNAQLTASVANQNSAVDAAQRDGEAKVAAAQARAQAAAAEARNARLAAQRAIEAAKAAKPDNAADLCASAQRANATFIKERQ